MKLKCRSTATSIGSGSIHFPLFRVSQHAIGERNNENLEKYGGEGAMDTFLNSVFYGTSLVLVVSEIVSSEIPRHTSSVVSISMNHEP